MENRETETSKTENKRDDQIKAYVGKDPFAGALGAKVEILKPGHSRATLTVKEDMVNFHGCTHGGVIFSLGDMAFAAASNSRGQTAVALNVGINFLRPSKCGDRLVAEAVEQSESGPMAVYEITVTQEQTNTIIAKSQNLVYRKKEWFVSD